MASRKIPPQVARELRRHVQNPKGNDNNNNKRSLVLLGCVSVTALAAAFPMLAQKWTGNLNAKEDALTAAQTRRGAFNNSGTRDVGKDPSWDFATGTYKRDPELDRMIRQENGKVEHDDDLVKRR